MDIEKLKILSKKASEAGELVKAVTAFKNELKDKEHMHDVTMSEHFKTLRDPLIEQQKKTDEKQDKVIEQLQKNQLALTSGIQDIMTLNRELPQLKPEDAPRELPQIMSGDEEEAWGDPPEFIEPNAEKFWDENLYKLIERNKLKTSKELYKLSLDELTTYQKIAVDFQRWAANQLKGPTKNKDMDQLKKNLASSKIYSNTVHNILEVKRHAATPKKGSGQPKRHAYKIQDGSYGGLVIDLPRLYNEMKLNVFRGGKLLYSADADKSLINLITKRFNPKTKYSINAVRIFNDLNTLANLPKHRSSEKTRMVGSSVTYYNDPNQLADRMKVLIGSMAAGNNSPLNINDLAQINDELLRIGAIDGSLHEKFFKKYLSH